MGPIGNIKTPWIIHIFALLHAAVALACRLAGIEDELLLTILTMTMALIICLKHGLNIEFTAASVIVVNILGYLMGTVGAWFLGTFIPYQEAVHSLSTFCTTEILGWSIVILTKFFSNRNRSQNNLMDSPYLSWLILAMCVIFVFRLGIVLLFSTESFNSEEITAISTSVFSNSFSLITLICINLIYIRHTERLNEKRNKFIRILCLTGFTLAAALLETAFVGSGRPFSINNNDFVKEFPILYTASLLAQITVYCLVYMINYAISARNKMKKESEKANLAQYRYIKLKHQVDPHFLFNSLNILDCLILDGTPERASAYTHKMAGIYRYMLKSEDEMVVPLSDELVFVEMYVDLLNERFPSGFEVSIDVPDEYLNRFILTCSLPLLIENAIKHNVVNEDNPLSIKIFTEGDFIKVTNNIIPKMTRMPSTGLGQKYIRQMYLDMTGKHIIIEKDDKTYSITLPLI